MGADGGADDVFLVALSSAGANVVAAGPGDCGGDGGADDGAD